MVYLKYLTPTIFEQLVSVQRRSLRGLALTDLVKFSLLVDGIGPPNPEYDWEVPSVRYQADLHM